MAEFVREIKGLTQETVAAMLEFESGLKDLRIPDKIRKIKCNIPDSLKQLAKIENKILNKVRT